MKNGIRYYNIKTNRVWKTKNAFVLI